MSAAATRYSTVAIALHWVLALLLFGQVAGGLYADQMERGAEKIAIMQLHKSFGITILLLTIVRLGWRLAHPAPPPPADMPVWERRLARATHGAFYVLLLAIPIAGWALVSASPFADSVQTYLFGVVHWPHLPFFEGVENRRALAGSIGEVHEYLAFATMGLVALHVAAALRHHFIKRDDVLARMIPVLARKK